MYTIKAYLIHHLDVNRSKKPIVWSHHELAAGDLMASMSWAVTRAMAR